tara:strand:+ start:7567 stop:8094 length:528 start_codon:yes stop_codon:yes gene_type:complete
MAFPLTIPEELKVTTFSLRKQFAVSRTSSPTSYSTQTYEHPGERWFLNLSFAPVLDAIVLATAWAGSTSYSVGNRVSNSSKNYICRVSNTSTGSFATDLAAGEWQLSDIHGCIEFYLNFKGSLGYVALDVSDYDKGLSGDTTKNFQLAAGALIGFSQTDPITWSFDDLTLEERIV